MKNPVRVRPHNWFDTNAMKAKHGVQVSLDGGPWRHVAKDGEPMLFDTEEERNKAMPLLHKRLSGARNVTIDVAPDEPTSTFHP